MKSVLDLVLCYARISPLTWLKFCTESHFQRPTSSPSNHCRELGWQNSDNQSHSFPANSHCHCPEISVFCNKIYFSDFSITMSCRIIVRHHVLEENTQHVLEENTQHVLEENTHMCHHMPSRLAHSELTTKNQDLVREVQDRHILFPPPQYIYYSPWYQELVEWSSW